MRVGFVELGTGRGVEERGVRGLHLKKVKMMWWSLHIKKIMLMTAKLQRELRWWMWSHHHNQFLHHLNQS